MSGVVALSLLFLILALLAAVAAAFKIQPWARIDMGWLAIAFWLISLLLLRAPVLQ